MKHSRSARSAYITGFALSVLLTLAAYLIVVYHVTSDGQVPPIGVVLVAVVGLAVVQLYVQVRYFLHLGTEAKPRWNLLAFLFMLLVVSILVFGTLWIMHNLNYHMMSPSQTNTYLHNHEGL